MIETILKTFQDIELVLGSKLIQNSEDSDNLNSWIIGNYTGYEIECSHLGQAAKIPNSEKN